MSDRRRLHDAQGRPEEAARLSDLAIRAGHDDPDIRLYRSRMRAENNDGVGATEDAMLVLEDDASDSWQVSQALELANRPVGTLLKTPRVQALAPVDRLWVGTNLVDRSCDDVSIDMLELVADSELPEEVRWEASPLLGPLYIRSGRCASAVALLTRGGRTVREMGTVDAFSYGMAVWGAPGRLHRAPFRRVVELARAREHAPTDAMYLQCLAVAYQAIGDAENAERKRKASLIALRAAPGMATMSYWRYRQVSTTEFVEDPESIGAWIAGDNSRTPGFLRSTAKSHDPMKNPGATPAVTPYRQSQLAFWTGFHDYASKSAERIRPTKPPAETWTDMAIGKAGFRLCAYASPVLSDGSTWRSEVGIRAELVLETTSAQQRYDLPWGQKDGIETEFGEGMGWRAPEGQKNRIIGVQRAVEWKDEARRGECYRWLVQELDNLHAVFAPRIRNL